MHGVGRTDIGKLRNNNEDSIFISNEVFGNLSNIYIVADGMGGHNAGEIASKKAIGFFCDFVKNNSYENDDLLDFMISATSYANNKILEYSKTDKSLKGMGTTFSACVIFDKKLYISHIGDSRIYIINKSDLIQISTDHTYLNDLLKSGQITLEESKNHPKRNILTKALGTEENIPIDGLLKTLQDDCEKILICSDGLTNMLTDEQIINCINENDSLENMVNCLVDTANENGGEDNISVILIGETGGVK